MNINSELVQAVITGLIKRLIENTPNLNTMIGDPTD